MTFSDRSNNLKNQNFSAPQASDLGRSSALSYPAREPPSGKVPTSAGRPCLTKLGVPHRVFVRFWTKNRFFRRLMLVFCRIPLRRDILEKLIFSTKIDANDGQQARRTPEVGSADVSTEISSFVQRKPPQLMPRRSGKHLRKLEILTPGGGLWRPSSP